MQDETADQPFVIETENIEAGLAFLACVVTQTTNSGVQDRLMVFDTPEALTSLGSGHADFERGFIKAEVVNYQDLLDNGSLAAAREKGIVGMEGKDYVVKDGDVILFRFNV